MAISYQDNATSSGLKNLIDCPREITLGMTRSMAEGLDSLVQEMDASIEEVLSQAVGLLMVAVEAQIRGQRICLTDDDLNVVTEIVNFGVSSEPVGDDENFETESDQADP